MLLLLAWVLPSPSPTSPSAPRWCYFLPLVVAMLAGVVVIALLRAECATSWQKGARPDIAPQAGNPRGGWQRMAVAPRRLAGWQWRTVEAAALPDAGLAGEEGGMNGQG